MPRTRNASPTLNGFLFQIDVAIYLMIKYIEEVDKIRVEGIKEDIELELTNNKKIMVQVKSQWDNLENKNIYTVKKGDSLWLIASKNKVSV